MTTSPVAAIISLGTTIVIVGLVLYRMLWSGPFLVALSRAGLLPQGWRRWILGEGQRQKPN